MTRIGIDIGSTTIKIAAINTENHLVFSTYKRHHAKTRETLLECLHELLVILGDGKASVGITGSVGMGVSEQCGLPFVQEVVAAANAIRKNDPPAASLIDIGGEDAKVVFFKHGECLFHDGKVAVASHDDRCFLHSYLRNAGAARKKVFQK